MSLIIGLFVLLFVPAMIVLNGYVLTVLFGWFLVPLGLPPISIPTAIGIATIVSFLTYKADFKSKADKSWQDILSESIAYSLLSKPLSALFVGYVVTLFM